MTKAIIIASNETLWAWFHEFYLPSQIPDASPATLRHWRKALHWFDRGLGRTPTIHDLDIATIRGACRILQASDAPAGLSASTLKVMLKKLVALWRFLFDRDVVESQPPWPLSRLSDNTIVVATGSSTPKKPAKLLRCMHCHQEFTSERTTKFCTKSCREAFRYWKKRPQGRQRPIQEPPSEPVLVPAKLEPDTPLNVLVEAYRRRRLIGSNPNTHLRYVYGVRVLERCIGRPAVIADLTEDNIIAVMQRALSRDRTAGTVNGERSKLIALWNFAAKRGALKEFPDIKKLKMPKRVPFVWMPDQMAAIFAAVRRQTWSVGAVPASDWFTALLLTIWDSAERIGAVLQIRWTDLNFSAGTLTIRAECRKWKTEDKFTELDASTLQALQRIQIDGDGLVFAWPWSRGTLGNRYKKILVEAGLNPPKGKAGFHALRRTVASFYQQAGGDACRLLGHSDRSVTEAYLSPAVVKVPQVRELVFRPDAKPIALIGGPTG